MKNKVGGEMNNDCKLLEFRPLSIVRFNQNEYCEILKAKGIKCLFEIKRVLTTKKYEVFVNENRKLIFGSEKEAIEYANDYNEKDYYDFVTAVNIWKN